MAIETPGWASFDGGDSAVCSLSSPSISGPTTPGGSTPPNCEEELFPVDNLNCEGARTSNLFVCGGIPPYSWSTSKGTVTPTTGTSTTLTPPANPGAAYNPGTIAYGIATKYIDVFCACNSSHWDCGENLVQECLHPNSTSCWQVCHPEGGCPCSNCATAADAVCSTCSPICSCGKSPCGGNVCPEALAHCFCDERTADQIANLCNPCPIALSGGAVVTVTDALGQTDFVTVYPEPRTSDDV